MSILKSNSDLKQQETIKSLENMSQHPAYKTLTIKICLAVALQLIILLSFAAKRAYTITTGTTVTLRSITVDPFDMFRGDYVNLNYNFTSIPNQFKSGDTVYTVFKQGSPYWQIVGTFKELPELNDSEVMIKGKVVDCYSIKYGIETFFVPEGQGKDLQRQKHLCVTLAVDKSGCAIVKSVVPE
jgi:uncharacterized membrane-anchored protein